MRQRLERIPEEDERVELAAGDHGPDLLIAACAQQHGAAVVHVDRHFETLGEVFAFTSVRL